MTETTTIAVVVVLLIMALLFAVIIIWVMKNKNINPSPDPGPVPVPPAPPLPSSAVVSGNDFLKMFSHFSSPIDPTGGISDYTKGSNLVKITDDHHLIIGTAGSSPFPSVPIPTTAHHQIPSVRLYTQNKFYNGGLFSLEVFHIPAGRPVWPAVWLSQDPHQKLPNGSNGAWPINGEIDWIEQVLDSDKNQSTLHIDGWTQYGLIPTSCETSRSQITIEGCSQPGCLCPKDAKVPCSTNIPQDCPYACAPTIKGKSVGNSNCTTFGGNPGCGVQGPIGSFGPAFNKAYGSDGAVFTMLWNKKPNDLNYVAFYFLTDRTIINDTISGPFGSKPDPTKWNDVEPYGVIDASANGQKCVLKDLQLIINIAICGEWPDPSIGGSGACADLAHTTTGLTDAYFEFGRFSFTE